MIFSFSVKCEADARKVPELLEFLGIDTYTNDPAEVFTIEVSKACADTIRARMKEAVDNNKCFGDMHRCYQTLKAGTEPDYSCHL